MTAIFLLKGYESPEKIILNIGRRQYLAVETKNVKYYHRRQYDHDYMNFVPLFPFKIKVSFWM